MLEKDIESFVKARKAVFLADIAREFEIGNTTAHDLAKRLEREGQVSIIDKGIAKLVVAGK